MELVSDGEYGPAEEIFTSDTDSDPEEDLDFISDDDDLDDFHPFALTDPASDDVPLVDDVLALPPQLPDQLNIGHPDGEHIVQVIPFPVFPIAAIPYEDWPFIVDLDDDESLCSMCSIPTRTSTTRRSLALPS
ncbi:hypothetical protein Hanom_Chr05g00435811 [Helianthus anomalus]